jgi:hypothetical protein
MPCHNEQIPRSCFCNKKKYIKCSATLKSLSSANRIKWGKTHTEPLLRILRRTGQILQNSRWEAAFWRFLWHIHPNTEWNEDRPEGHSGSVNKSSLEPTPRITTSREKTTQKACL